MFYSIPNEKLEEFKNALNVIGETYKDSVYANDMMITMWKSLVFKRDADFMNAFSSAAETEQEKSLIWRLHTFCWAGYQALKIEGDFVECGVFKGFCSSVLFKYLNFGSLEKNAYLYDTFSGLPCETSTVEERQIWDYSGANADELYESVKKKFSVYKNVFIVKGVVPYSFNEACPKSIAFLHVDMNSERAEMMALEHLYDRVSPGGLILLDDFGWTVNSNQAASELEFFNKAGCKILELPTGQGLIIKN